MQPTEGVFRSPSDGTPLAWCCWRGPGSPKAIVQILHGISDHLGSFAPLAEALAAAGFLAAGYDQRGHGASAPDPDVLGDLGPGGFAAVVADVSAFGRHLAAENPGLPLFLFGHSMGAYAAQHTILDHPGLYAGVVQCGTTALDVLATSLATAGARIDDAADFNSGFEGRTDYDWLSSDPAAVDAFLDHPLSGYPLPPGTLSELLTGVERLADPAALAVLPPELPICLLAGRDDPLAGDGRLIALLAQRYRTAGLLDVEMRVYQGARHQLLIERIRHEVIADTVSWLRRHLPR